MIRLLTAPGTLTVGDIVPVEESEAHHLKVRRAAAGTPVQLLDGRGGVADGRLLRSGGEWEVSIELTYSAPRPAETVIAVGGGDKERFLLIAEKAAELGITRVVPLETSQLHGVETRVREGTIEKARRRAQEACKQSGCAWIPVIDPTCPTEALSHAFPGLTWLLADLRGGACPALGSHQSVGWLIGPEAGFGLADVEYIENVLHPTSVGLGPHLLRFETAAIAAMAVTAQRRLETHHRRLG